MAVRNLEKGDIVANEIRKDFPNAKIDIRHLELNSLESIHSFAKKFINDYKKLDVLINNA
jgi:NAD(P)-dependent dehydrogenase (short-subunit alcohol dehydrogenase family)